MPNQPQSSPVAQNNIEPQVDDTFTTPKQSSISNNSEVQVNDENEADDDIKSIQKKVGEITQYISSHKDETLAKYVVGMVNSIAGKYLTQKDKQKAIDKLNKATDNVPDNVPDSVQSA